MATFDLGGLLGSNMFGGGDMGLEEYLTPEQRARMNQQGIMALAASLLKSSGPSAVPVGIGQALGEAYGAGQTGYQQAQTGAIANIMTKQKLDDAKRARDRFSNMQKILLGDYGQTMPAAGVAITPEQSLAMPNMPAGPTVARANMIGQLPTTAQVQTAQQVQQGGPFANLSREQRALMLNQPEDQLSKSMLDVITASQEFGPTEKVLIGGVPRLVQFNKSGQPRIVQGVEPFKAEGGAFGGGVQGSAYDILLTEEPSTAKYALAWRILNQPVPVEKIQPDGSIRTVYEQPVPLPSSFPKPSYTGRLPVAAARPSAAVGTQPTTTPAAVQPVIPYDGSVVTQPQVATRPVTQAPAAAADGPVATPLPAGAKAAPMAARPEEFSKNRGEILAAVDFVAALKKMENMVREEGMQLGGIGEKAAGQSGVYEDLLTKARLAAQLGVLNKEDLPRLQAQLSDPTALSTYIKGLGGPNAFFAQIRQLEKRIVEEATRKNLQFGSPIMTLPSNFVIGGVAAPATSRSRELEEALRKYPSKPR
jgi:hypothetical protein